MMIGPAGVGDSVRGTPGEHVGHAAGGIGERGPGGAPAHPHQVGGEDHVRVVEQRVVRRWFGFEHIQAHTAEPARGQGVQHGVQVDESAAPAVDQHRAGAGRGQQAPVEEVMRPVGQRQVKGENVGLGDEIGQVGAVPVGRWRSDRIVREYTHPERFGEVGDPASDPAVADDADRRAVQVTDGIAVTLRPPAFGYEGCQRAEAFDQMQGEGEYPFRHRSGAAAGRDHDRQPAGGGRLDVDQVDADPGAGKHLQARCPRQQAGVDDRVGAHDRPDRHREIGGCRVLDEPDIAEDRLDDGPVDRAESDHDRPREVRHGCSPRGPAGGRRTSRPGPAGPYASRFRPRRPRLRRSPRRRCARRPRWSCAVLHR
jgi:hypothetical protein